MCKTFRFMEILDSVKMSKINEIRQINRKCKNGTFFAL